MQRFGSAEVAVTHRTRRCECIMTLVMAISRDNIFLTVMFYTKAPLKVAKKPMSNCL